MKPVKCDSCKKFYDADKYESCPHCRDSSANSDFSVKKETAPIEKKTDKLVSEHHERKSKKFFSKLSTGKTETKKSCAEGLPEAEDSETSTNTSIKLPENEVSVNPTLTEEPMDKNTDYEDIYSDSASAPVQPETTVSETEPAAMSISEAVKKADAVQNSSDQKTIAFYNFSNDIEPVVGWLVCIKGEYHGASFNLKSGRNNIGRALTMDVALAQEKSVSRERHASITFEPHQKKFFIQSGDGNGLTYVNDELLMMFKELQPYDVISLGACKLMFLPLCGEKFAWEDYM